MAEHTVQSVQSCPVSCTVFRRPVKCILYKHTRAKVLKCCHCQIRLKNASFTVNTSKCEELVKVDMMTAFGSGSVLKHLFFNVASICVAYEICVQPEV